MPDIVGGREAAPRLGVKAVTFRSKAWMDTLPPPEYPEVNGAPAWNFRTLLRWAGRTGKLSDPKARAEYTRVFGKRPRAPYKGGTMPTDLRAMRDRVNGS